MTPKKKRILILSHGHPDVSPGGAEHAAYMMFQEFKQRPDWEPLFIAAEARDSGHETTPWSQHGADGTELIFHGSCEYFRFRQVHDRRLWRDFRDLLDRFEPDIVHLHHYANFGVEILRSLKNWSANVPVVLTLHEYLAICHHNGQMVKTEGMQLCNRASPSACARCFPDITPKEFLLRELYLKSFLDCVDLFVSPSRFLRTRYIEWGIPEDKITVVENGQQPAEPLPPRPLAERDIRGRFAYLGQLNPYKGITLLLEAIERLARAQPRLARRISLAVHGTGLHLHSAEFRTRFEDLLARTKRNATVYGSYRHEDLPRILSGMDWVVVPSVWWENSPLVIQEAFKFGRPVIVSDIGGMKEKVQHGKNGLHFRSGNVADLAECLALAARDTDQWSRLRSGIEPPPTIAESVDRHIELFEGLSPWLAARATTAKASSVGRLRVLEPSGSAGAR